MPSVKIPIEGGFLQGDFSPVEHAKGIVIFAHGSGSSRFSPRNRMVAKSLEEEGFCTLLFDLLTEEEEKEEKRGEFRFNIDLLSKRLSLAIQWAQKKFKLPIGLFGASTGAAAALKASLGLDIFAIVSRGGRPDLAEDALPKVRSPTLLIVGGEDFSVIELNQKAKKEMAAPVEMSIVEGATHLFEEKGKLEKVVILAKKWFLQHVPDGKQELLSILRDRSLPMDVFRKTAQKLMQCLTEEHTSEKNVVLIPILRSGLAMLPAFIAAFPKAPIGFLGMLRDEKTLKPHLYYKNLPPFHEQQKIFILEPMLATGGSIKLAIELLLKEGVQEEKIFVVSLIGSEIGIQEVRKKYPRVQIKCLAIDKELDSSGFIVPGLGDFGDRFFGTQKSTNPYTIYEK